MNEWKNSVISFSSHVTEITLSRMTRAGGHLGPRIMQSLQVLRKLQNYCMQRQTFLHRTTMQTHKVEMPHLFRVLWTVIVRRILQTSGEIQFTRRKYNNQPEVQQRQPIPTIVNRYTLPNNHHEDSEASQPTGMVGKTASVKVETNCISKPRKK